MSPQEQYLAQNSLAILRDKNVRAGEDSHYEIDCVTPTKQRLVNCKYPCKTNHSLLEIFRHTV